MVKDRRFLVGLGCGLIAGALLLQIMLFGEQQQEKLLAFDGAAEAGQLYSQAELDEQLAEQARELEQRYKLSEGAGDPGESGEAGAGSGPAPEAPADGAGGSASAGDGGNGGGSEPGEFAEDGGAGGAGQPGSGEEAASPEEASGQQPAGEPLERAMVYIRTGMTLQQTAALLADHGLIEREQALIDLMRKDSRRIRAGWFLIEGQPTLEQLAEILTSEPISTVRPG